MNARQRRRHRRRPYTYGKLTFVACAPATPDGLQAFREANPDATVMVDRLQFGAFKDGRIVSMDDPSPHITGSYQIGRAR